MFALDGRYAVCLRLTACAFNRRGERERGGEGMKPGEKSGRRDRARERKEEREEINDSETDTDRK